MCMSMWKPRAGLVLLVAYSTAISTEGLFFFVCYHISEINSIFFCIRRKNDFFALVFFSSYLYFLYFLVSTGTEKEKQESAITAEFWNLIDYMFFPSMIKKKKKPSVNFILSKWLQIFTQKREENYKNFPPDGL